MSRMPNVRIEKSKKAKALGVSLPPELILQAKKYAFSQGMSFSKFVRSLLARELIEIQKKCPPLQRQKLKNFPTEPIN